MLSRLVLSREILQFAIKKCVRKILVTLFSLMDTLKDMLNTDLLTIPINSCVLIFLLVNTVKYFKTGSVVPDLIMVSAKSQLLKNHSYCKIIAATKLQLLQNNSYFKIIDSTASQLIQNHIGKPYWKSRVFQCGISL